MSSKILVAFVLYFIILIIGALIIGEIENWRFLDSFYMMVMTSTTIGYGDFTPVRDGGKLFISFYSLLSVGSFLYALALFTVVKVEDDVVRKGIYKKP